MTTRRILGSVLLALATLASVSVAAQEGAVKYRQGIMKAVGGHSGAIAEIAYGGVAFKEQLAGHTHALLELSKLVTMAFKEKALTEDPPTRSKPDIWDKWSEFEEKAAAFGEAATALDAAAKGGDLEAVAKALDPLWDACKGCHEPFRAKE
jgi:cytochrome c556